MEEKNDYWKRFDEKIERQNKTVTEILVNIVVSAVTAIVVALLYKG